MDIDDAFVDLLQRVRRLEVDTARSMRPGTIAAVRDGSARVRLGGSDDAPFLSPWMPYSQMAGAVKGHVRPSDGQQVVVFAPGGDLRRATAIPFTWSNENPSPGQGPDPVLTYGDVRLELRPSGFKVSVGAASIELTSEQAVTTADLVKALGTSLKHNDLEIGDTHRHRDVEPGAGLSGVPAGG